MVATLAERGKSDALFLHREEKGRQLETRRGYAEVCFVPNAIGHSKKGRSIGLMVDLGGPFFLTSRQGLPIFSCQKVSCHSLLLRS